MIKSTMDESDYKLLSDSYYGEGGFKDGSYLTQHKREPDAKLKERKLLAYYMNYIQPVVDSHVNAVFSNEPSREYVDKSGYFELFIKDADTNGNSLNRVMKEKALKAKLKASVLIVVDNYKDQPSDVKTAQETRSVPYIYHVEPENIIPEECLVDSRKKLTTIVYREDDIKDGDKTYMQKRLWDTEKTVLYKKEIGVDNNLPWIVVDESFHNCGCLPCFLFNGTSNLDDTKLPTSQFLHPAMIARAIYNICSEIREIQRKQCFNILTMQGTPPKDGVTVGTENIIWYELGMNQPAYIAPDEGPAKSLGDYITVLTQEIYRMSCVSYTQQYASSQQSGESKRWTFHITRQVLEDFAVNCEDAERKIAYIFGKYINHDLQFEVNYSRKYGADDLDADIERTDIVLKMDMPDAVKAEVLKKFISSYFAEDDDKLIEFLKKYIDEDLVEKEAADQDPKIDGSNDNNDDNMMNNNEGGNNEEDL